jgi:two-component system response regulator AtoC
MCPKDNRPTILIAEDELEVRAYLQAALECQGFSVETACDGDEVLSTLQSSRSPIAAILMDIVMPNRDGLETLREIRRTHSDMPVIVISGTSSTLDVATAMKLGAVNFLSKPVVHEDLRNAVRRIFDARGENGDPKSRKIVSAPKRFVGRDPRMREIHSLMGQIGSSEAPVLIYGETGSGKEVLARELHAQSPRANQCFLKLNCAALPSELVESELFGYERGAFTGAVQRKAGMFEVAHKGTILLDEIGDMDVRLQAKLLQVLQDYEFQRIGGRETIKVDVRVMAATHRNLETAILKGTFREDLYYRLDVINMMVPPLRERSDDIIPMAEFLINKHCQAGIPRPSLTPELRDAMLAHRWPGNVRELENFARKFLIIRDPDVLARELLAKTAVSGGRLRHVSENEPLRMVAAEPASILDQVNLAKEQGECEAILKALNSTRWNRKQAAVFLRIDYKALLYKMKKLGLEERTASFQAQVCVTSGDESRAGAWGEIRS